MPMVLGASCWNGARLGSSGGRAGRLVAALVVGLVVGCESPPATPAVPGSAPQDRPVASPALGTVPRRVAPAASASPTVPDALVARATADAAGRVGARPSDVRVVLVEAREWSDRSLGCPRPGLGYAQAITPGYLIVLEAAGQRFEYNADQVQVGLCER
jgi:hypothetical protein